MSSNMYISLILLVLVACGEGAKRPNKFKQNRLDASDENDLMRELKRRYEFLGTETRPVFNTSETMQISLGMALIYLDSVTPKEGGSVDAELTATIWLRYSWNDIHLRWNPNDYSGADHLRIPIQHIWRPDITLYTSFDLGLQLDESSMAVVSSDGSVLWIPPAKVRVPAKAKPSEGWMSDWLGDGEDEADYDWSSKFKFGSWTYDGFKMDIDLYDDLDAIDLHDFSGDRVEIVDNSAKKNVKYYPCCAEPYPDLVFNLKWKAK